MADRRLLSLILVWFSVLSFSAVLGHGPEDDPSVAGDKTVLACLPDTKDVCSGNGRCNKGTCICDDKFSGFMCELSADEGTCKTYRECSECVAFGTKCPDNCNLYGEFRLVQKLPANTNPIYQCRYLNSVHNCTFHFHLLSRDENGQVHFEVKTCLDIMPVPDGDNDKTGTGDQKQKKDDDKDNSAAATFVNVFLMFAALVMFVL